MTQELVTRTEPEPGGALDNQRMKAGLAAGNGVIDPERWQMLAAIAETVFATAFVPAGLRGNKPSTLACLLYGDSQGLHPMVALKEVHVIDGTPTMSAALMVAQVRSAGKGHRIKRVEIRDEAGTFLGCKAVGERGDDGETDEYTFTLDMAARAGLLSKKNWQHYPEAMCWHRAASQLATFLFPDVFLGSPYVPEELGEADTGPDGRLPGQAPTAASERGEDEPVESQIIEGDGKVVDAILAAAPATAPKPLEDEPELGGQVVRVPETEADKDGAHDDELTEEELEAAKARAAEERAATHGEVVPVKLLEEFLEQIGAAADTRVGVTRHSRGWIIRVPSFDEDFYLFANGQFIKGVTEEFLGDPRPVPPADGEQMNLVIPSPSGEPVTYSRQSMPLILTYARTADAGWLEGFLSHERTHKNRARLIAELEGLLAERKAGVTLHGSAGEGAVGDAAVPPEPADGPAAAGLAAAPVPPRDDGAGAAAGPPSFTPSAEPGEGADTQENVAPEVAVLAVKIRAACAWLNEHHPHMREWQLDAVLASCRKIWPDAKDVTVLEELTLAQLEQIWVAVPDDAKGALGIADAAGLAKLAGQA